MRTVQQPTRAEDHRGALLPGAVLGSVTAGVAVAVAHLVATIIDPGASPILAVGESTIDASPGWLKDFAIRTFGSGDKVALLIGIGVVLTIGAIALGMAAFRRPAVGMIGLVCFAALGAAASLTRPDASLANVVPTLAGLGAGAFTFSVMERQLPRREGDDEASQAPSPGPVVPGPADVDRRRFLLVAAGGAAVAVMAGGIGRVLARRAAADESRAGVRIPAAGSTAGSAGGADLAVGGLSPFITPNDRFYRVDTALLLPSVMAEDWRLHIRGMVDREISLDYAQLLERPLIERDITLACVSNPVGGSYVGNARWVGAPIAPLLEEAGVHPEANQLVSRSVDGFTVGTPTEIVMDGRDAMLAVAMNGEPLPIAHGFPVRMVVPGLYGYVSATKWVVDMELTTFDAFDPYWIERGWAEQAPIKTMSRIDAPRSLASIGAGRVPIAGVAWAQHRGITRVEVQVDDDAWTSARLAGQDTVDTWRQWVLDWEATPGEHLIRVRATDGDGVEQTDARAEPFPDGATGLHEIVVRVS